ncbi:choline dehydrogenase 7 [Irineochytrium annulatum]|nr:choline dehydrogenase 7 [Irineochytrium annulatum]
MEPHPPVDRDSSDDDSSDSSSSSSSDDLDELQPAEPSLPREPLERLDTPPDPFSEDEDDSDEEFEEDDSKRKKTSTSSSGKKAKGKAAKKKANGSSKSSGGGRTVPYDSVSIPMGDKSVIEKLITWRQTPGNPQEEVLVKYKNLSYMHTEWVPRAVVEATRSGKGRVQKLLAKSPYEYEWSEDEPFNPSFLKIDRIIDDGETQDDIFYLVKWCAQTYDSCTWESRENVEKCDPEKIEDFNNRRLYNAAKQASLTTINNRPPAAEWRVMEESPTYKSANKLRPYQLEGLNWLLFWLGKTVQSTVFLYYLYQRLNVKGPFLIVTPLSTIGNWEREIKNWTDLNVVVYHGNDTSRNLIVETEFYYRDGKNQIMPNVFKFDVILTTYEMAMSGLSQLKPIFWRCVVLDEAHRLKNKLAHLLPQQSKISEVLKQYKMEHKVLLTGTPLQNSIEELWSLLNFLQPEKFGSRDEFQSNFSDFRSSTDVEKLQALLKPLMLRRLKEGAEDEIIREYGADTPEKQFSALVQASGKMVLIDKLLKKLKDGGHKVLIFSQMTKCLDLIQDYLKGQRWGFERIDGSIRGDLRQALIGTLKTICKRKVEYIVLAKQNQCKFTGTPGLLLLQNYKTYRLVTRNTYEREMFDRASLKLGLDKAILQRMDAQSAYGGDEGSGSLKDSGLSKTEIEELLKKGAYGAFMDDDSRHRPDSSKAYAYGEARQYCGAEFDLFQSYILYERRFATYVQTKLKDFLAQVDINDPNFWDKIAEKAQLNVPEVVDPATELILDEPRERRRGLVMLIFSTDNVKLRDTATWGKAVRTIQTTMVRPLKTALANIAGTYDVTRKPGTVSGPDAPKYWSLADKTRLERGLMMYGYARWDKIMELCRFRSVDDLKACSRSMIKLCLSTKAVEEDVEVDVKACLALDGIDIDNCPDDVPYPGATAKQIAEYRSCLVDAPRDYKEHIEKKAKNLLLRVQMMYTIRDKIAPTPESKMPLVLGNPPAPWWGADEDRDLLIGTLEYGYQQYEKIATDPKYCFASKLGFYAQNPGVDANGAVKVEGGENGNASSKADKMDVDDRSQIDDKDDIDDDMEKPDGGKGDGTSPAKIISPGENIFPSPSDLGQRIRRIIQAFIRHQVTVLRDEQKRQKEEERIKARQEKEDEKNKLKERELTKKDKLEFYRTLVSYGVDTDPVTKARDWTRFKEISQLRKTTDVMDEYYIRLITICDEILDPKVAQDPEKDYDSMTPEKAKKLLKRVALMRTLRDIVLAHPNVDTLILDLRKYGRNGLPETRGPEVAPPVGPSRIDERFWMKEAVAMKRFNSLCDSVVNPVVRRGGGVGGGAGGVGVASGGAGSSGGARGVKRKSQGNISGSDSEAIAPPPKKAHKKEEPVYDPTQPFDPLSLLKRKRPDRSEKLKKHKLESISGEDSDPDQPAKKKKKHKKKHSHRDSVAAAVSEIPPQLYAGAGDYGVMINAAPIQLPEPAGDAVHVKKKKKHKKSGKGEDGDLEGNEPKKKKSKEKKKKHQSDGYISADNLVPV